MLKEKIKTLNALKRILSRLKKKGKRVVFTNGCFDLLHFGHAKYLEEAKKKGDILVVGINSDRSVRSIKGGKRPVVSQKDRLGLVAALESVDYAVMFEALTPLKLIKAINPDIMVKGSDWSRKEIVGGDLVRESGGRVSTVKLVKGRSTTNLIRKIAKAY